MTEPNFISQEEGLNFNTMIEAIIKHSCIVDFGIVEDVVADGIVNVAVAVSRTPQDMQCMTCVLANIASTSVTLKIVPHKGDRVLVLYPRIYNDKMFDVKADEGEDTKLIIDLNAKGYNLMSGIAILINQYKESGHENLITIEDGNITSKLNNIQVTTTTDGDITVDNGKATVSIDKDGNVSVDAQGKYTIKNASTDLKDVIDGLAKELENLTTVGSPATQSTSPASKGTIATWRSSKLTQLFT